MEATDRELAESQQQLREKVNGVKCVHNVSCLARVFSDRRKNS